MNVTDLTKEIPRLSVLPGEGLARGRPAAIVAHAYGTRSKASEDTYIDAGAAGVQRDRWLNYRAGLRAEGDVVDGTSASVPPPLSQPDVELIEGSSVHPCQLQDCFHPDYADQDVRWKAHPSLEICVRVPTIVRSETAVEVCFGGLGSRESWSPMLPKEDIVITFLVPGSAEVGSLCLYGASFMQARDRAYAPAGLTAYTGLAELWATDTAACGRAADGGARLVGRDTMWELLVGAGLHKRKADLLPVGLAPHESPADDSVLEVAAAMIGAAEGLAPQGRTVWRGFSAGTHFLLELYRVMFSSRDPLRSRICGDIRVPTAIVTGATAAPLNAWGFLLSNHTDTHVFIVQCPEDGLCPVDVGALRDALAAKIATMCTCTPTQGKLKEWLSEEGFAEPAKLPPAVAEMAGKFTICEVESPIESAASFFLGRSGHSYQQVVTGIRVIVDARVRTLRREAHIRAIGGIDIFTRLWNLARTARVFEEVEEEVLTRTGTFDTGALDRMSGDGRMDGSFDKMSHFASGLALVAKKET